MRMHWEIQGCAFSEKKNQFIDGGIRVYNPGFRKYENETEECEIKGSISWMDDNLVHFLISFL